MAELGRVLVNLADETPDTQEERAIAAQAAFEKLQQMNRLSRVRQPLADLAGSPPGGAPGEGSVYSLRPGFEAPPKYDPIGQVVQGFQELNPANFPAATDPYQARNILQNQAAQGFADIATGAAPALMPFAAPALAAAPLSVLAGVAGGAYGGMAGAAGLEALARNAGASPGVQQLAGVGGGLAGGAVGGALGGIAPGAAETIARMHQEAFGGLPSEAGVFLWKPGMKLNAIPPEARAAIPKAGPRLTIDDLGAYFNERIAKTIGQIPADASAKQKLARILKLGVPEFEDQLSQPNPRLDFYTKDTPQADRDIIQAYPELSDRTKLAFQKAMSAVFSTGNTPNVESENGGRAYQLYRQTVVGNKPGQIPLKQPSGMNWRGTSAQVAMSQLQKYLNLFGSEKAFVKFLMSPQKLGDIRKLNPSAKIPGSASDIVPGSYLLGPKVGAYYNDIMGIPQEASTIDRWEVRANHRRWGDTLRDGKMIDAPLSPSDRDVMMEYHHILADRYTLERNEAQSGTWHYEKDLYTRLGVPSPPTGRSDGTLRVLESLGKKRKP